MKTKIILSLIIILTNYATANAKIWRVNNNPSLNANVLQPGTLFDGTNNATNPEAAAGDSIYLEPSATTYGGFDINKANIVVLGYGYFLSNNPGAQANTNNSRVNDIGFQVGSTGSSVSGVELVSSGIFIYTNNISVTRCKIPTVYFYNTTNANGIRIDKCFITAGLSDGTGATVTNVTIAVENCIFSGVSDANTISGFNLSNRVRGLFRNNTMNYCSVFYCFNFYIANNIFTNSIGFGTVSNSGNNVFRNNLFSYPITTGNYAQVGGNTAPNSNNQFSVNMANVFNGTPDNIYNVGGNIYNNYILLGAFNPESRLELKAGSTAIAAGESGVTFGASTVTTPNCGAYGATDPYRKGGFPAIPRITALTVPSSVTNGATGMTISISSSSNN
jgi:hypothetical protein